MLVTLGQGTQRGMSVQLSRSRARDLEKGDFLSCRVKMKRSNCAEVVEALQHLEEIRTNPA